MIMTHEAALPVLFLQELLVVVAAAAASSELGVDKGLGVIGGFVFWGLTTLKLDPNTLNETYIYIINIYIYTYTIYMHNIHT